MSEQERSSQVSALFDGELPQHQAEMVIRRALKDPATRTNFERYALIGACLRNEPLSGAVSVADRVQARIAAERDLNVSTLPVKGRAVDGATGTSRFSMFGRGALGGAIAAGVAMMAVFIVREMDATGDIDGAALLAQADGAEAQGYTTPGENSPAQRRLVDASLGYYLIAHSEEAASALRSNYDLVPGGVELTEDEISAWR